MGTRIQDYPVVTTLGGSDKFIVDGASGTRSALASEMLFDLVDASGVGVMHNVVYRGKNLGSAMTNAQYNQVKAGTFNDLYLGDYWTISGHNWRIMHFDYFGGSSSVPGHHIVLMPDDVLGTGSMMSTDVNSSGITGTTWFKTDRITEETAISQAFPSKTISHTRFGSSVTNENGVSSVSTINVTAMLPSEMMVFGSEITSAASSNTEQAIESSTHMLNAIMLNSRLQAPTPVAKAWLADPAGTTGFAGVSDGTIFATRYPSTTVAGYRPYFLVG